MDIELRRRLSQDLRRLVTGRISNDEFDEIHQRCSESNEEAVRSIAEFGYGLYSSELLLPYRLTGFHAVGPATRRTAARCVLFLRSELSYEWPALPERWFLGLLLGMSVMVGIPTGLILSIIGTASVLSNGRDQGFWRSVTIIGSAILAAGAAYVIVVTRFTNRDRRRWQSVGDFDVWPFFRREQFYEARRNCFLIGS